MVRGYGRIYVRPADGMYLSWGRNAAHKAEIGHGIIIPTLASICGLLWSLVSVKIPIHRDRAHQKCPGPTTDPNIESGGAHHEPVLQTTTTHSPASVMVARTSSHRPALELEYSARDGHPLRHPLRLRASSIWPLGVVLQNKVCQYSA
jgi:hypothetical protein